MLQFLVPAAVGAGLALFALGILLRARDREQSLADILDLPYGERDVAVTAVTESRGSVVEGTVALAGRVVDPVRRPRLAGSIARAGPYPVPRRRVRRRRGLRRRSSAPRSSGCSPARCCSRWPA